MDLKMSAETITTEATLWDCKVENGIVPIIHSEEEKVQAATLACFLETNSVPLLPDVGVPWVDFLNQKISFGDIDYRIRNSLYLAGRPDFYPQYDIVNDRLTLSVVKMGENNEL